MAHGTRIERVGERVRTELSTLLARKVRDPGVLGVTITLVKMTADLQRARVYYTLRPGNERRDTARALRRSRPFLRRELGHRLQLRHVPDIRFLYDDSAEQQDRVARIFDELERARSDGDDAPPAGNDDDTDDIQEKDPRGV